MKKNKEIKNIERSIKSIRHHLGKIYIGYKNGYDEDYIISKLITTFYILSDLEEFFILLKNKE